MSSFISSNDDDLFEYEPDEEVNRNVTSIGSNDSNLDSNELLKKINKNIDHDLDLAGNLDNGKVRFALAYQMAYEFFLSEVKSNSSAKAIRTTLDTLTNGDFSLLTAFYELEMRISKKMIFLNISHSTFDGTNTSAASDILESLAKFLNITFTDLYVKSCYHSTWNITYHTLAIDRAAYLTLSKKLQLPVQQVLFEDPLTVDHDSYKFSLDDFKIDILNKNKNILLENGMLEELKSLTGSNVEILVSNDE